MPEPADVEDLGDGIAAFNRQEAGGHAYEPLAFFPRRSDGAVAGRNCGAPSWGQFYVGAL